MKLEALRQKEIDEQKNCYFDSSKEEVILFCLAFIEKKRMPN